MNTDLNYYDYDLPNDLIAQNPINKRDMSKLLILDKKSGKYTDEVFLNIINFFKEGDTLVLNNTKVIPGRVYGRKSDTNAKIEVLLLKDLGNDIWQCITKPQKRLSNNTEIDFDKMKGIVTEIYPEGITHIKFEYNGIFNEILEDIGLMPLPPYIHETLKEKDRYQTVYAKNLGSAAAPTAGLHFTNDLLKNIKDKGVEILEVTLNVGIGTFRPVNEEDITKHNMHSELYEITEEVANRLNKAKNEKRRIIAVGTTTLRTLESNLVKYKEFKSTIEETNIFIYPPYKIKSIDGLITNFHLPKSTLLMLVSSFSSRDNIINAYNHAVEEKYRFFSFGDAMFITDVKE